MVKDNPSDDIFNYFYKIIFNKHPLSMPILGTKKSLKTLDSSTIRQYFEDSFRLDGIVISAAGNIDHKLLVEKITKNIEGIHSTVKKDFKKNIEEKILYTRKNKIYKSNTEASHICLGSIGCSRTNKDRYPLSLFTNILGGSISSRLFQKIREEKGLSYAIFASNTQYTDSGVVLVYAATSAAKVYKVIDLIDNEISMIKKYGVSAEELSIAKENTKGNIVLGVEDISSRMFRLGKALLIDNRVLTIDEILKRIDKVTVEEVNDAAVKYFQKEKMSLVVIGKTGNGRIK